MSSTVDAVIEQLQAFPEEQQREVLEFVVSLARRCAMRGVPAPDVGTRTLRGLMENVPGTFEVDDLQQSRRELWSGFPRPLPE